MNPGCPTGLKRLTPAIDGTVGVNTAERAEVETLVIETKSEKVLEENVKAEKSTAGN